MRAIAKTVEKGLEFVSITGLLEELAVYVREGNSKKVSAISAELLRRTKENSDGHKKV